MSGAYAENPEPNRPTLSYALPTSTGIDVGVVCRCLFPCRYEAVYVVWDPLYCRFL